LQQLAVQHTVLYSCMESWTLATLVTQMERSVGVGTIGISILMETVSVSL